ncbi:MAG TPA: hypothetical protein VE860_09585, partial [Chthoniobacterales bacterium]|nr:hypothetical protein [Chthoniobacterales bacterium]
WRERKIIRYGFHGSSFRYATNRIAEILGLSPERRLIICHLGGGCSLAAVRGIKSIDTTMGFSPLDGIAMIGESEPSIRSAACSAFSFLGLQLDERKNREAMGDSQISTADSAVRVHVIQSRESWQVGMEAYAESCKSHPAQPRATNQAE